MQALLIVLNVLLILNALVLIVAVLMQEGNRAGLGAIGGAADTFFGKNKARGIDAKLQLITKIGAATFIVLAIVSTALSARVGSSSVSSSVAELPVAEATAAPVEDTEATEAPVEATEAPAETPAA